MADRFTIPSRQQDFRCPCGRPYTRNERGLPQTRRNGYRRCPDCGREFQFARLAVPRPVVR